MASSGGRAFFCGRRLGAETETPWHQYNGRDLSLVEAESADNKGYGNSTTLAFDVTDADTAKMILLSLAETVGRRLRRDGAWIETVSVALRFFDLSRASHQCVLDYASLQAF